MVPLTNIAYSYGFGVYESLRVSNATPKFTDEHCARLMASAASIGLAHAYEPNEISRFITELIQANEVQSCNIKILLIGGETAADASLYIQCLAPRFVDRKLYKTGVHCTIAHFERLYPHAKTLNMLPSYLAYREAHATGAHDALLINHKGEITEGTRSNFFAVRGNKLFSPPESDVLLGVTRAHVLVFAQEQGFEVVEEPILFSDLQTYDGAFLTSTSAKIVPIRSIDEFKFGEICEQLRALTMAFNNTY